jgi:pyrimidine operon attenuation protein/uracil phosphoribosyltransferase
VRVGGLSRAAAQRDGRGKVILTSSDIDRTVERLAHQILERADGGRETVLLGIQTRGVPLARRLAARIRVLEGRDVAVGALDVTAYRDDHDIRGSRPSGPTEIPEAGVTGHRVILVDDVLFSGRTVRAALDAITEHGRPQVIQLAVLVDRGHRELPIRADYVGKNIPTAADETVWVSLRETDQCDEVRILRVSDL